MGMLAGVKWVLREGVGIGASRRWVQLILGKAGPSGEAGSIVDRANAIRCEFLEAAETVTGRFGPSWAKRRFFGRTVGVWLLALLWMVPATATIEISIYICFVKITAFVQR